MGRKSSLTDEQWNEVERRHVVDGVSINALAIEYGVNESSIRRRRKELTAGDETHDSAAGFVYVIAFADSVGRNYYKIGFTSALNKRLKAHQCSSPFEIRVAISYYVPNMYKEEGYLHALFSDRRVRGEWFDLNNMDLVAIATRSLQR